MKLLSTQENEDGEKDDYINASNVTIADRGHSQYIVSQAPLAKAFQEFWWMIWQEGIETVVCLATDLELAEAQYFPSEKGSVVERHRFEVRVYNRPSHRAFFRDTGSA